MKLTKFEESVLARPATRERVSSQKKTRNWPSLNHSLMDANSNHPYADSNLGAMANNPKVDSHSQIPEFFQRSNPVSSQYRSSSTQVKRFHNIDNPSKENLKNQRQLQHQHLLSEKTQILNKIYGMPRTKGSERSFFHVKHSRAMNNSDTKNPHNTISKILNNNPLMNYKLELPPRQKDDFSHFPNFKATPDFSESNQPEFSNTEKLYSRVIRDLNKNIGPPAMDGRTFVRKISFTNKLAQGSNKNIKENKMRIANMREPVARVHDDVRAQGNKGKKSKNFSAIDDLIATEDNKLVEFELLDSSGSISLKSSESDSLNYDSTPEGKPKKKNRDY